MKPSLRLFGSLVRTEPMRRKARFVQPLEEIAEQCVGMVLEKEGAKMPALVCLPVTYAYGGTTRA